MDLTQSDILFLIQNNMPCFTLNLSWNAKTQKKDASFPSKWSQIQKPLLNKSHNGIAILTGKTFWVLDIDNCWDTIKESYRQLLWDTCGTIVQTRRGYHFYYSMCQKTAALHSDSDINHSLFSDNPQSMNGVDIRAIGGCVIAPPTTYKTDSDTYTYTRVKGTLADCQPIPDKVWELLSGLHAKPIQEITPIHEPIESDHKEILDVLQNLATHRIDSYSSWIAVGMALKNSGYPFELWDEWSKQSPKYTPGETYRKWNTFLLNEKGGLTKRSLYQWLKEDNYSHFIKLKSKQTTLYHKLLSATNASVAEVFYELNPAKYIYSSSEGWFVLQENSTWLQVCSLDILAIPGILNAIRSDCCAVLLDILNRSLGHSEQDKIQCKLVNDCMKKVSTSSFLKGVSAFLQGMYYIKDIETYFNSNKSIFAFSNCILDTESWEFRQILPTDYISITCGYTYRNATEMEMNMVHTLLSQIFPEKDVLAYVLQAISCSFHGHNRDECFHIMTGLGANGKSTLNDLCKIVFGNYFKTLSASYLTKDNDGKKDKPLPELADAHYTRMLVSTEPEEKDKFQVSLLKQITGNDTLNFRGMYSKKVISYVAQFKLWIAANDIPKLSKFDGGIQRRARIIHFPIRFVDNPLHELERKKDITLKEKIINDEAWKYGFIGLLLKAGKELGKSPLVMPQNVRDITNSYMLDNNPIGAWLQKYYDLTGRRDDVVQKTELFNTFIHDTGADMKQKTFSVDILKCNIYEKTLKGKQYYYGLVRKSHPIEE